MESASEKKACFDDLPPEIKFMIWEKLDKTYDKHALALTRKTHHKLFEQPFYRWAVENLSGSGLLNGVPILASIAAGGSVSAMKKLVAAGADLSHRGSLLCTASQNEHVVMVRLLLEEHQLDPNTCDTDVDGLAYTPLSAAAMRNNCGIVTLLIAAGADPNLKPRPPDVYDVLSDTIINGNLRAAALLIDAGASVIAETQDKLTPLFCALEQGNVEFVRKVLLAIRETPGADINAGAPLVVACRWAQAELVRVLLDHGAAIEARGPASEGPNALEVSIAHGFVDVVKVLFEYGVSPAAIDAAVDNGAVLAAIGFGFTSMVQLLATNGVPVNNTPLLHKVPPSVSGMPPLEYAVAYQNKEMVKVLVQAGAVARLTVDERSRILWTAFRHGGEDMLLLLIEMGVCEHTPADTRWSTNPPLRHAVSRGMVNLVSLMVEKGADPNLRNSKGDTVLTATVKAGNHRMVLALLGDGTNPETWTRPSEVLAGESSKGHMHCIDEMDNFGQTPLYLATTHGMEDIVRILLARGSRAIHTAGHVGMTPIEFATRYKNSAVSTWYKGQLTNIWSLLNNPASARIDRELVDGNGSCRRRAPW